MKYINIPKVPLREITFIPHMNIPPRVLFPSKQGTSEHSQITVSPGQKIKRGQIIGKPTTKNSQILHSSIGGTVKKVRNFYFPGEEGNIRSVEIQTGGDFSTFYPSKEHLAEQSVKQPATPGKITTKETFLKILKDSGIYDIDIGVLYHYLSKKINNPEVNHLVINAVEFTPFHILEEKVLALHTKEICQAVQMLLNIFQAENQSIKTILNTNSIVNYTKYAFHSKKIQGTIPSWNFMNMIRMEKDFLTQDLQDNYMLVTGNLSKKIRKQSNQKYTEILNNIEIQNTTMFIKPSTLLALYELLVFNKPQLDIYIQMMIGFDNIVIQKVPLGTPLLYLLAPYNAAWKKSPQHCFFDGFLNRKSLFSFSTPITKNHRHFYFLEDADFSLLCKKLKKWVFYNNIE